MLAPMTVLKPTSHRRLPRELVLEPRRDPRKALEALDTRERLVVNDPTVVIRP
jgi:hypothetical protein